VGESVAAVLRTVFRSAGVGSYFGRPRGILLCAGNNHCAPVSVSLASMSTRRATPARTSIR
jgi:hypothetical protein